jgi:hypothetical protein
VYEINPRDWKHCPEHIRPNIARWVENGLPPGSFLEAVLKNDLLLAVAFADEINIRSLPAIVAYITRFVPPAAYGSFERYEEWMRMKNEEFENQRSHL